MAAKRRSRGSRGRRSSRGSRSRRARGNLLAVVGAPAAQYCSICGGPSNVRRPGKCERHGKKILPNTEERIRTIHEAQRNARTTGKTWVVAFRPRTKGYHAYHKDTLERTPIGESHMITDVVEPTRR